MIRLPFRALKIHIAKEKMGIEMELKSDDFLGPSTVRGFVHETVRNFRPEMAHLDSLSMCPK